MSKYLLIAEKPSVMRAIQDIYNNHRSEFKDNFEFGAFHGHLMALAQPDDYDPRFKSWTRDTLPIIPDAFKYVEDDKESCKSLMQRIKAGNYDALINACDAGREGEHIFFSFYEAHNISIPVLRFWASDTTETTILATLKGLLPAAQFDGMRQAAKYRAQLDWLSGINFSRAGTLSTNKKLNIGRVMSPTLKIIVDREREITSFVPKDFYEIQGMFTTASGNYDGTCLVPPENKQTRFAEKNDAEALKKTLGKKGTVLSVVSKTESTKAPTLYSLLELQKDASKYFGYSADKTLNIAQSLYENPKEYISYPRTESRFLPTAMIKEIPKHLRPIEDTPLKQYVTAITQADIDRVTKGKEYVDNAKITDHHAIIPTMKNPNLSAMSADEQNIYLLICKRFISIFMPPYVVAKSTIVTDVGGVLFKTNGKVELDKGYGVLYVSKAKDVVLPLVKKGDAVDVAKVNLTAGQTTPPVRFNTATILDAMQNAGNFVSSEESRKILKESAGLGTSATRAAILKKLETVGMVEIKKNTFYPTEFGMSLIDAVGDRPICSPEMTADWEKKLRAIEDNAYAGDFLAEMIKFVTDETNDLLANKNNLSYLDLETVGVCPKCGKPVTVSKNYFKCAGYKESCDFIVGKDFFGTTITTTDIKFLLKGSPTKDKVINGKDGGTYKAPLILDNHRVRVLRAGGTNNNDNATVDFNNLPSLGVCPKCGGKIYVGKSFYLCSNRDTKGCQWQMKNSIRGANVSPEDVKTLLSGKPALPRSFNWDSGRSSEAIMYLDGGALKFKFS